MKLTILQNPFFFFLNILEIKFKIKIKFYDYFRPKLIKKTSRFENFQELNILKKPRVEQFTNV